MSHFDLSRATKREERNDNGNKDGYISKYQEPGVEDNVKISEVLLEVSSKKAVPFLRLKTVNPAGAVGSSAKMFLSTTPSEGKEIAAFDITARNIVDLIMATHNVDEDTAKGMIGPAQKITSNEQLRDKVAAILVGKPFRAKFKGEITSKGNTFAVMGPVESMRVENTRMKFNPDRDIKPYVPYTGGTSTGSTNAFVTSETKGDDFPF
jgi:hypothetical protein